MSQFYRFLLVALWLVLGTLGIAIWWIYHPDTALNFSGAAWMWLIDICGAKTAAEITDVAFVLSIFCLGVLTLIFLRLFHSVFTKK